MKTIISESQIRQMVAEAVKAILEASKQKKTFMEGDIRTFNLSGERKYTLKFSDFNRWARTYLQRLYQTCDSKKASEKNFQSAETENAYARLVEMVLGDDMNREEIIGDAEYRLTRRLDAIEKKIADVEKPASFLHAYINRLTDAAFRDYLRYITAQKRGGTEAAMQGMEGEPTGDCESNLEFDDPTYWVQDDELQAAGSADSLAMEHDEYSCYNEFLNRLSDKDRFIFKGYKDGKKDTDIAMEIKRRYNYFVAPATIRVKILRIKERFEKFHDDYFATPANTIRESRQRKMRRARK